MSTIATFTKTPNETIDIVISFSEFLIEKNDELESFEAVMPEDLILLDTAVLADRAKIMISGGSVASINGKPKTNHYVVSLILRTRSGIVCENFITILVNQQTPSDPYTPPSDNIDGGTF